MSKDYIIYAQHREGWGHCKDCKKWCYFLTYDKLCPTCKDKEEKQKNATKS